MSRDSKYNDVFSDENAKVIIYGAGCVGNYVRKVGLVKAIDFFCDKNAERIKRLGNIKVIFPKELANLEGNLNILVCINDKNATMEMVQRELSQYKINARLYDFFDNLSFPNMNYLELKNNKFEVSKDVIINQLKINIVCYEDPDAWILGKFARKLNESLVKLGIDSKISREKDPIASINHHIFYMSYKNFDIEDNSLDTSMITHIAYHNEFEVIKSQAEYISMGICMSRETMDKLVSMGVPKRKLCYINPAQDGVIKPKKYILGITSKVHGDLRKNESMLVNICEKIDCLYFKFVIMGNGWNEVVDKMRKLGFEVDYYNEFDYENYTNILPTLDFYLYFGSDEGSMGFLDALAAGVDTIVTPQGYHMDIPNAITYPCETEEDFVRCLNQICANRKEKVEAVSEWTWDVYAKKHLDIWNYLLKNQNKAQLYKDAGKYNDGIFSVFFDSACV